MPAGDLYELALDCVFEGQACTNTYRATQVGADGTGDPRQALASAFNVDLWPLLKTNLVETFVQRAYRVRGIHLNETQTLIVPADDTGTVDEIGLPPNCVLLCRNYAQPIGRKGTGRNLFSGIPESQLNEGNFDGLYLGGWSNYTEAVADNISDPGSAYIFRCGVWNSDLEAVLQFQRSEVQPRCRTLRSRTIGAFAQ